MKKSEIVNFLSKKTLLAEEDVFCFSMDVDWASESCIKTTVDFFLNYGIPLTIFCTHPSDYLDSLKDNPNIMLGIHPNFISDSSQGRNYDEVVDYLFQLLPDAICFRGHRWFSSNDIYDRLIARGILFESNGCSLFDVVTPFLHRSGLISFPAFWEDGAHLWHGLDVDFNSYKSLFLQKGIKVINFHPFHFCVNTPYFKYTRDIKDKLPREIYNNLDSKSLQGIRYNGYGISSLIQELVGYISRNSLTTCLLYDIYKIFK